MTTQPNDKQSTDEIVDAWLARQNPPPQITEGAAGFPASILEALRKQHLQFDVESILPFVRNGADLFAPLPGVDITRETKPGVKIDRLSNLSMYALVHFRPKMTNGSMLHPHYPKGLRSIPYAGSYATFDERGDIKPHREINVLEYAAVTGKYQLIPGLLSARSLPDQDGASVKEAATSALDVFVTGGDIGEPQRLDLFPRQRTNAVISMIQAGVDLQALGSRWANAENAPHARLLEMLIKTLAGAKPGVIDMNVKISAQFAAEIESAIEKIAAPGPLTGTVPFDINYRNPKTQRTLLHAAVEQGTPAAVQALLQAGADVDAEISAAALVLRTGGSMTPLAMAQAAGNDDIAAVLQVWKAKTAVAKVVGNVLGHPKQHRS